MRILVWTLFALLSVNLPTSAQREATNGDFLQSAASIPGRDLDKLGRQYARLSSLLQQQSSQLLKRLQRQELKEQRRLYLKNSALATSLFKESGEVYQQLQDRLTKEVDPADKHPLKEYLPGLDSMQTAVRFLVNHQLSSSFPTSLSSLQSLDSRLGSLQNQLQQANAIQAFAQQRQLQLLAQGKNIQLDKEMQDFRSQIYYHKQQVQEYKEMLHDPDKLAGKVLSAVRGLPAFQHFMQNNSYLSSLFRVPGSPDTTNGVGLAGLQTRDQVAALVAERLGPGSSFVAAATSGDHNNSNPLGGSMEQAQDQMNQWKDKIARSGGGGSSAAMPDFAPNTQHNKTFLKRIQLNFDMQSQPHSGFVPALSTLGLNLGYRLNDRSILGIGGAYFLGWGQPFNHIALSSQGASIRSFINWKWKGNIWLSGGYEANYLNAFAQVAQLRNIHAWQPSGLLGLLKTYKAGKRQGNIQLLYDCLHAEHVPQSPAFIFRAGYSLY